MIGISDRGSIGAELLPRPLPLPLQTSRERRGCTSSPDAKRDANVNAEPKCLGEPVSLGGGAI